jgi:uncharacterized membrane protein YjgN (DUF898 family)
MQPGNQTESAAAETARTPLHLSWSPPEGMVGLSFVNYFLRIITLGIYHFWGKTEVRRRVWSAVRLNGEPLQYTGTGKELFLGFLIVFGVVLLPIFLVTFGSALYFGPQSSTAVLIQLAVYAVIFVLLGIGIYRAQRFRLSRTRWRGIRGGLDGSAGHYAWTYIWTGLLMPLTLGWISPWRATKLQSMLVNNMRFGNRSLHFDARSGPLYPRFAGLWIGGIVLYVAMTAVVVAIMWPKIVEAQGSGRPPNLSLAENAAVIGSILLSLLLLAIIGAWYRAKTINHFAAHTHFEGARFKGTATAGGLIWLAISNFMIGIFSLGILAPIVQARSARYQVENLHIEGAVPLAAIAQGAEAAGKYGEGIAQAFDFDAV